MIKSALLQVKGFTKLCSEELIVLICDGICTGRFSALSLWLLGGFILLMSFASRVTLFITVKMVIAWIIPLLFIA